MINVAAGVVGNLTVLLLTFVQRMIFIRCLSEEYLGLNILFPNILSVLDIAEIGIVSAMVYSMYKPAAQGDQAHLLRLVNLNRRLHQWAAAAVTAVGLLLLPFLNAFVKDGTKTPHLRLIFLLYLFNTVSAYFLNCKNSILLAYQRAYYRLGVNYACCAVQLVIQSVVLIATRSYILFLVIQLLSQLAVNIIVSRKVDQDYPYLKSGKELPDRAECRKIVRNVGAMCLHTTAATVKNCTDNILISAFAGLTSVGLFSNYQLIFVTAKGLLERIYAGFSDSIGNLGATESGKKVYEVFKNLDFFIFVLYGYATVGLFVMCSPFIELAFGEKYPLPISVPCLLAADFYLNGMRQIMLAFRTALGLFRRDRYKAIAESIIKLTVSLLLVGRYGVEGVLLGTVISTLTTSIWVEPYVFLRYGIKDGWKQKLRFYFGDYVVRVFSVVAASALSYAICHNIASGGIGWFLGKCCICTAVYAAVILVLFSRRDEFKYLMDYGMHLAKAVIRKVSNPR